MPQLNKEKLDQMKQAVITALGYLTPQQRTSLEIELSPFAMEMTDEDIMKKAMDEEFYDVNGFIIGAKFIRDGK